VFSLVRICLKPRFFGRNLTVLVRLYGYAEIIHMKFLFIEENFLWTIKVSHFSTTMTSAELSVSWFPTNLGYFKTLSAGK